MKLKIFLLFALSFLIAGSTVAEDYKEYKYNRKQTDYFQIKFYRNNDRIEFIGFREKAILAVTGNKDELRINADTVFFKDKLLFDEQNLIIEHLNFPFADITDSRITETDNAITISFLTQEDKSKLARFKKGNRFKSSRTIIIPADDFVRGMVLNISGDISINGEVNKDVISLFGNIMVNDSGVVRGNCASINGKIKIDKDAALYGEIYDSGRQGRGKKFRMYRDVAYKYNFFSLVYNRVDGLAMTAKFKYHDIDSLLPTVEGQIGYGLASDRGRYLISVEQVLLRDPVLSVGGSLYRQLISEDDRLIGTKENSIFALIAKEDYMDYYEAEGGSLYLKSHPTNKLTIEAGYTYFESNWLRSHRYLWSLFGGDKLFDLNYRSWHPIIRSNSISEVDTATVGYLYTKIDYNNKHEKNAVLKSSYWHLSGDLEWSKKGLQSDFDYRKYTLAVRRYQQLSRNSILLLRTVFSNSDGYLPNFKRFYLGGLGTVHGYEHKEYMGSRYWMANSEYRVDFPHSEFGFSVFWDIGQIANDQKLDSDIEIKQSLGLSLFFEDDFKISLAKRLDRSFDDSPKLYVRFSHIL